MAATSSPKTAVREFSYLAFAYRQTLDLSSPYLLSFVAPVDEVHKWGGVPRRDRSDGFQRLDDSLRVTTIRNFFGLADSQSPTSIVVGVTETAVASGQVTVTPLLVLDEYGAAGFPEHAGTVKPPAKDSDTDALATLADSLDNLKRTVPPVLCRVTFRIDPSRGIEEIAAEYRDLILSRLRDEIPVGGGGAEYVADNDDSGTESSYSLDVEGGLTAADADPASQAAGLGEAFQESASDLLPSPSGDDNSEVDDEQVDDEGILDIRDSTLRRLATRLSHPSFVRKRERDIRDLVKPATIIDGQHRVLGASQLGAIPFNVVAIMAATWAEQVFQFTILNYTAKPLPGQFIAGNAAITLTCSELNGLRDRLITAGIKIKDVDVFAALGADSRSPFYDLISVQERLTGDKLGYGTMMSIGSAWMDAKPAFLVSLLAHLYPAENKRSRVEIWRRGVWQTYCWAFWSEVKNHFIKNDQSLWVPGGGYNLMITAVLRIVQNSVFELFNTQLHMWRGVGVTLCANDR